MKLMVAFGLFCCLVSCSQNEGLNHRGYVISKSEIEQKSESVATDE